MATQSLQTPATPLAGNATPVASSATVKGKLQKILAMREQDSSSISPATEMQAKAMLDDWDGIVYAYQNHGWAGLAAQMDWRVTVDAKFSEALARLDDLHVMQFRRQYEDYLAMAPQCVQTTSRQPVTARNSRPSTPVTPRAPVTFATAPIRLLRSQEEALAFLTTHRWSDILERLRKELAVKHHGQPDGLFQREDTMEYPLLRLLQTLARLTHVPEERYIDMMQEHVDRDDGAQSRLAEYAADNRGAEIVAMIEDDLRNLDSAPRGCQGDVPAMREAIAGAAATLFVSFRWNEVWQSCTEWEWRGISR